MTSPYVARQLIFPEPALIVKARAVASKHLRLTESTLLLVCENAYLLPRSLHRYKFGFRCGDTAPLIAMVRLHRSLSLLHSPYRQSSCSRAI